MPGHFRNTIFFLTGLLIQHFALIYIYIYLFFLGREGGVGVDLSLLILVSFSSYNFVRLVLVCLFWLYNVQYFVFGFVQNPGTHCNLRLGLGEKLVWWCNRWGLMAMLSAVFSGVAVNTLVDSHTKECS